MLNHDIKIGLSKERSSDMIVKYSRLCFEIKNAKNCNNPL